MISSSARPHALRCALALALLALPSQMTAAEADTPHGEFAKEWKAPGSLLAQLTPIEQVLKAPQITPESGDAGIVMLNKRLVSIDAQGRKTILRQAVYKSLNEAGAKANADEVFTYKKKEQRPHLLIAETIQPDGTRQSVKPNAIFIQSPQRQAEYSLYDDQAEFKVIFPNVKPGSITHIVYAVEELVAKIPGEFTQSLVWGSGWPSSQTSYSIEMPESMARRLKIAPIGSGLPAMETDTPAPGIVRHTWKQGPQPGHHYDYASAPSLQVGPAVTLSTLASWDQVGQWFSGLTSSRNQAGEKLLSVSKTWIPENADREGIIKALHTHIANDVRYVGLEFGAADYQPHHCDEVWDNQYGDCKDKANLLVALLKHHGVKANIALLNTEHAGLVNREAPDFRAFSHAIVAIPQPDGTDLFCDPTIEYSVPGMLSNMDSDRDILIIGENGARWGHTPQPGPRRINYDFDLKLSGTGELSGWMSLRGEGYYSATERSRFEKLDAEDLRSELGKYVRSFFEGAEVVDVQRVEQPSPAPFEVKAYFIVKGGTAAADGSIPMGFPSSSALYYNLGTKAERETTYVSGRDILGARAVITLPEGFNASSIPAPFSSGNEALAAKASWSFRDGKCIAEIAIETRECKIKPEAFSGVFKAMQALKTWVSQPVVLKASTGGAVATSSNEIDLPMMPSADGQIDLVDKRYPDSGNPESRRLALEKSIQYYPSDKNLCFRAGVRIAVIDWDADRLLPAYERLNSLVRDYADAIRPETFAWGQTNLALVLRDLKRTDEAIALLRQISANTQITDDRRATAAVSLFDLLEETQPRDAEALLTGIAELREGGSVRVFQRLIHLRLHAGRDAEAETFLSALAKAKPDSANELLKGVLEAAAYWSRQGDDVLIEKLVAIVQKLQPSATAELKASAQTCLNAAKALTLRKDTKNLLQSPLLANWFTQPTDGKTLAQLDRESDVADNESDSAKAFKINLQALAIAGDANDFAKRLWNAVAYADWVERQKGDGIDPQICDKFITLSERLPVGSKYHFEAQFLKAKRFARADKRAEEQATLRAILAIPNLDNSFLAPSVRRLELSLVATGALEDAIECSRRAEPLIGDYGTALDSIVDAIFLNLALERDDEALRLIGLMKPVAETSLKATTLAVHVRELRQIVDSGKANDYWAASRAWWPLWLDYASKVGMTPEKAATPPSGIEDLMALGQEVGTAKKNGDKPAFFEGCAHMFSVGRWLPSMANELAAMNSHMAAVDAGTAIDLRKILIKVLDAGVNTQGANLRNCQLLLAAHLFDDGRQSDAMDVVRAFNRAPQLPDNVSIAMHRIQALCAVSLNEGVAEATALMEKDLSDPAANFQRLTGVLQLAELLRKQDRPSDEEALLTRELSNKIISSVPADKAAVAARLASLVEAGKFNTVVDAWIQQVRLPWLAEAVPLGLEDPGVGDLETLAQRADSPFSQAELAKLMLLASKSGARPLDNRKTSFSDAIWRLMSTAPTYARLQAIGSSTVDNPDIDENTRVQMLWNTLLIIGDEGRAADYKHWRSHKLVERFNENTKQRLTTLDQMAEVSPLDLEGHLRLQRSLVAKEISYFGTLILTDSFSVLLRHGRLKEAEGFVAGIDKWKLASDASARRQALKLDFTRSLRALRESNPVHEALMAELRKRYPAPPAELPTSYKDLRMPLNFPVHTQKDTIQACIYLAHKSAIPRANFSFWGGFLNASTQEPQIEDTLVAMLHAGLAATTTEDTRVALIHTFSTYCDWDNEKLRARLMGELAPFRNAGSYPRSYAMIRLLETTLQIRTGAQLDLETAMLDVKDPLVAQIALLSRIPYYTRQGNKTALRSTLDKFESGMLLNPHMLSTTIPAFRLLGMEDELRLATELAERELRSAVVTSWVTLDNETVDKALGLAYQIQRPDLLPDAWVEQMGNTLPNPLRAHSVRLNKAFLSGQWDKAATHAAEINRLYPTHYHYYWYRGFALYKLGRNKEAGEALSIYTKYSKNEFEYPEAVRLLASLTKS